MIAHRSCLQRFLNAQYSWPKFFTTSLTAAVCSSTLMLGGCSSSSDDVNPVTPEYNNPEVEGYAVKGLLSNADVTLFTIDLNHPQLKGEELDTGTTDDTGAITGLTVPETLPQGPFLIEVTNGQELDGSTPVIPTLRSIVRANQLVGEFQTAITVTPLTTMVMELTRIAIEEKNDPTSPDYNPENIVTLGNLYPVNGSGEIDQQASQLKTYFGLGLLDSVNLFTTQPLLTQSGDPEKALAYRTVIEATAAMINQVQIAIGASDADALLLAITQDISDSEIDGEFNGNPITAYNNQPIIEIASILSQSPAQLLALTIPGTNGTPISQLNTLLAEQALLNGADASSAPAVVTIPRPTSLGPDSDGDGVIDLVDAFPSSPNEQYDSDGDGIGDNTDFFPNDASKQVACDSDDPDVLDEFNCDLPQALVSSSLAGSSNIISVSNQNQNRVVTLDGTGSYDPLDDNATLTYQWQVVSVPRTSDNSTDLVNRNNLLDDPTSATPSFEATFAGEYEFNLVVSNGSVESPATTITITFQKDYYLTSGGLLVSSLIPLFLLARARKKAKQHREPNK